MIHLAKRLADTFTTQNHTVAVVSRNDCVFHNIKTFEAPLPNKGFSFFKKQTDKGKTYEELLYTQGLLDTPYLEKTHTIIEQAIKQFKPDILFDLGNPLAIVSGRLHNIDVYSYGHVGMFRKKAFPHECLNQFNDFLKNHQLEQLLYLHDLFKYSKHIFVFGPNSIQPFDDTQTEIIRLGTMVTPPIKGVQDHICVFLNDMQLKPRKLNAILEETFLGAPITVDIYYPQCKIQTKNNLNYYNHMFVDRIANSKLCFHDGSEYLFNLCISLGIPQVIINDSSCLVSWNAHAVKRHNIGDTFLTKDFSVASIYETYRKIIVDPTYQQNCNTFKTQTLKLGNLNTLLTYINEQ